MLLLSHIAPFLGAGNFIHDIDQPTLFGRRVTRREAHIVGMFIHLLVSTVWGGGYALLVAIGIVDGFGFVPIILWSIVLMIVMGGVVLPLEGHGIFGWKEDAWFPLDIAITNLIWAVMFWWIMHVWIGFTAIS